MEPGDKVITVKTRQDEQPGEIKSRHFGIVQSIKGDWVTIALADGSTIKRKNHNVAVYVKPPPNWPDLFHRQEVPPPQAKPKTSYQPKVAEDAKGCSSTHQGVATLAN